MLFKIDPISRKVETKHRIESQISVLKKRQKVESEVILKEAELTKTKLKSRNDARILALQTQIVDLEKEKVEQAHIIDERTKIALDRTIKEFDQKIIVKQNKLNRVRSLIDADKRVMEEITADISQQTNTPSDLKVVKTKKILNG